MILTCPNCATDFLVPDHQIGPEGREVKCDECGEVWVGGVKDPAPEPQSAAAAVKSPPASATPEAETPNVMFAPPKAAPAPKAERGRMALVIVLMVLALTALGFIAFQGAVVKAWPGADGVYRAIGLSRAPAVRPSHG